MGDFYTCGACGEEFDRHANHELDCKASRADRDAELLRQVSALPPDVRLEIRRRAYVALRAALRLT